MYKLELFFDGEKLHIKRKEQLITWLKEHGEDFWCEAHLQIRGATKVSSQQKLYFVWCDIMYKEFGWDSKKEMHDYLKEKYNGGESTKTFDTKAWSDYMIKVQAFANEHNITLPLGLAE